MCCDKYGGSFKENSGCVVCYGCSEEIRSMNKNINELRSLLLEALPVMENCYLKNSFFTRANKIINSTGDSN